MASRNNVQNGEGRPRLGSVPGPDLGRALRHTALTALAQLRTAAVQAALAGADVLPAAPPAARNAPAAVSEPAARAADLLFYTGTAPLPPAAASPARPASPRSGCPPPRPPASSTSPATGKRHHQPRPPGIPAPLVSMAQTASGPRPLAPLQHPPGSPHHLIPDDRKEVTPRNRHASPLNHAELQRGHRPENSNCNLILILVTRETNEGRMVRGAWGVRPVAR